MLVMSKKAFSMIELVFAIVIMGILAAIAIPKFAATRTDAQIAKGRSDVAAIRSAIVTERQSRIIKGESNYINKLHSASDSYFDGNGSVSLLMYGIVPNNSNGHWKTGASCSGTPATCSYTFQVNNVGVAFTYSQASGTFTCDTTNTTTGTMCSKLTD